MSAPVTYLTVPQIAERLGVSRAIIKGAQCPPPRLHIPEDV